jgi:hypothetical protein
MLQTELASRRAVVMTSIRQREPARMPQHVRVSLESESRGVVGTFDHPGEASSGERVPRSEINTYREFGASRRSRRSGLNSLLGTGWTLGVPCLTRRA